MTLFAKVEDNTVTKVIVANQDFIDTMVDTTPGRWIETFADGSKRKNCAGIGYTYDFNRDAFISPQPYPSWTLDTNTCQWESPVAYPNDNVRYNWDEDKKSWVKASE